MSNIYADEYLLFLFLLFDLKKKVVSAYKITKCCLWDTIFYFCQTNLQIIIFWHKHMHLFVFYESLLATVYISFLCVDVDSTSTPDVFWVSEDCWCNDVRKRDLFLHWQEKMWLSSKGTVIFCKQPLLKPSTMKRFSWKMEVIFRINVTQEKDILFTLFALLNFDFQFSKLDTYDCLERNLGI